MTPPILRSRGRGALRRALWAAVHLLVVSVVLLPGGCGSGSGEGFALYLLADDAAPADLAVLSHVEPADEPLISSDDVVSYSRATHEMTLTPSAYSRVSGLDVPLSGRSFAVCVDGSPVYTGAFVVSIWSGSFDGVVVFKPIGPDSSVDGDSLSFELGYPGADFFTGKDPRADPAILDALERAGLLLD